MNSKETAQDIRVMKHYNGYLIVQFCHITLDIFCFSLSENKTKFDSFFF